MASPRAAGEGAAKPLGWGQGVKNPKCLRLRGRRAKRGGRGAPPRERARLPLSLTLSPLSRGEGIGECRGVATPGFHGRGNPYGALEPPGAWRARERNAIRLPRDAHEHALAHAHASRYPRPGLLG